MSTAPPASPIDPLNMFLLHCPHCGELRDEQEFSYAGEAFIARPEQPEAVDDARWGDYLFMRQNTKGWFWEQWQHTAACRKVLVVKRHTASYAVAGSWTLAEGKALWLAEKTRTVDRDIHPIHPKGATA